VELAVALPAVVLLVLALLEVVIVARTELELVAAAREGARVAATTPDPAQAVEAVKQALGNELAAQARISITRPAVVGRPAVVRVELRHSLVTPVLRWLTIDLKSRAVMRVER
jgi:Flp pilus assembly protein TadG